MQVNYWGIKSIIIYTSERAVETGYKKAQSENSENCVTLNTIVKPGRFILSLLPQSKEYITVATILVP